VFKLFENVLTLDSSFLHIACIFLYTGASEALLLIYQYTRRQMSYCRSADTNKTKELESLLKNGDKR